MSDLPAIKIAPEHTQLFCDGCDQPFAAVIETEEEYWCPGCFETTTRQGMVEECAQFFDTKEEEHAANPALVYFREAAAMLREADL